MSIEKVTQNYLKHEQLIPPYVKILNETLNQIRDCAALGIYTFLASKPEGWDISTPHLMSHFGKGRDFINARIKYLKEIGAISTHDVRDDLGRFVRRETVLKVRLSTHSTENPYCGLVKNQPTTLKTRLSGYPEVGKSAPSNNRYIEIKEKEYKAIVDSPNPTLEKKPSSYKNDERFMRLYSVYPRKEKPADAWKAFKALKPSDELLEQIITDVQQRAQRHTQWSDKRYIPLPASYLRSAGYEGEIYNEEEERLANKAQADKEKEDRVKAQEEAYRRRAEKLAQDDFNKHNDAQVIRDIHKSSMPNELRMLASKLRVNNKGRGNENTS